MADKMTQQGGETGGLPASRPSHPLMTLRDEVDRLFDNFFPSAFGRSLFDLDPWRERSFRSMGDITPHMDVRELDDRFEISAELPGLEDKDVTVKVQGGVLSISGEKKAERTEDKGNVYLSERSYGSFVRSVRLPENADAEGIGAEFAKGVLTVTVPKREGGPDEKKIEVKVH
ncbi:MAG: Hsp20/alpha crystallin family protein [Rhodospirillaceae bacterium]|nr:Hsp20/alpha crystallin family protein [Rhodospirillales bacterium]